MILTQGGATVQTFAFCSTKTQHRRAIYGNIRTLADGKATKRTKESKIVQVLFQ